MNRTAGSVVLALLAALSLGAAEPEGFGDLRWGDPAPKGWKFAPAPAPQVRSERSRGRSFGGARLERIEYEFSAGRLVGVTLLVKERSAFVALKKELESRYGEPGAGTAESPAAESYRWEGESSAAALYYLGEGAGSALFLTPAPGPGAAAGVAGSPEEFSLRNRIRLCAILGERMDRSIEAMDARTAELDQRSDRLARQRNSCGSSRDDANRASVGQQQKAAVDRGQTAVAERAHLQNLEARLRADLEALRARGAAPPRPAPPPAP